VSSGLLPMTPAEWRTDATAGNIFRLRRAFPPTNTLPSKKLMHWNLGLALLFITSVNGTAGEFRFESVEGRFGFSANHRTRDLHQVDAAATWKLPWDWRPCPQWRLETGLDFTAGGIFASGPDAFVTSLGPTVAVGYAKIPLALELGVSPTLLSRQDIGETDFGSLFQLTSHAGLNWDLGRRFRIGYRFQHMSNCGITDHNPGLNLHVFSAGYRF